MVVPLIEEDEAAPISDKTSKPVLYLTTPPSLTKNLSVSVVALGIEDKDNCPAEDIVATTPLVLL